ncbi:MAG: hypothetical protein ACK4ON_12820, partial [Bacteroidia bacterium]
IAMLQGYQNSIRRTLHYSATLRITSEFTMLLIFNVIISLLLQRNNKTYCSAAKASANISLRMLYRKKALRWMRLVI